MSADVASSVRVRSDERCTMTGCSPAVRTLVALKRFASPWWSTAEDNLCSAKTPSGRRSSSELRPRSALRECRRPRKRVLVVQSAQHGFRSHERTRCP